MFAIGKKADVVGMGVKIFSTKNVSYQKDDWEFRMLNPSQSLVVGISRGKGQDLELYLCEDPSDINVLNEEYRAHLDYSIVMFVATVDERVARTKVEEPGKVVISPEVAAILNRPMPRRMPVDVVEKIVEYAQGKPPRVAMYLTQVCMTCLNADEVEKVIGFPADLPPMELHMKLVTFVATHE